MIKTVQQGIEIYKKEIRSYIKWAESFSSKQDPEYMQKTHTRIAKIHGMEVVLELSKQEIKEINEQARKGD